MRRVAAVRLTELLQFPVPSPGERSLPCPCGLTAHCRELRPKLILTAVGEVQVSRPWFLCAGCHHGQFPADVELYIESSGFSPGLRRMRAVTGQAAPFDPGARSNEIAGWTGSHKQSRRTHSGRHRRSHRRGYRRTRAVAGPASRATTSPGCRTGEPIPLLYIQMDGTGVPVTSADRGKSKAEGQPAHTRVRRVPPVAGIGASKTPSAACTRARVAARSHPRMAA